ncbi:MAG: hypothetical protein M1561_06800 [Gammaproteobacteria bacterium]|nr:hypothetical protein [Gammaproteobacteria bacterium]
MADEKTGFESKDLEHTPSVKVKKDDFVLPSSASSNPPSWGLAAAQKRKHEEQVLKDFLTKMQNLRKDNTITIKLRPTQTPPTDSLAYRPSTATQEDKNVAYRYYDVTIGNMTFPVRLGSDNSIQVHANAHPTPEEARAIADIFVSHYYPDFKGIAMPEEAYNNAETRTNLALALRDSYVERSKQDYLGNHPEASSVPDNEMARINTLANNLKLGHLDAKEMATCGEIIAQHNAAVEEEAKARQPLFGPPRKPTPYRNPS